jgi:hypothetical protein
MSWDAWLTDDRGHCEGDWNYTHNTSGMVYDALDRLGIELPADTRPCSARSPETGEWTQYPDGFGTIRWWEHLNGMSGPDGAAFLHKIIGVLRSDPVTYEAMNPANGWGTYEGLLKVLEDMRDCVPEWPCTWGANG